MEFNFINKIEEDNHELYFIPDIKPEIAKNIYYMTNEKSRKILDYIKSNNSGVTKTEISKKLDMHPITVKKYINVLKQNQLIHSMKDMNKTLFFFMRIKLNKLFIFIYINKYKISKVIYALAFSYLSIS